MELANKTAFITGGASGLGLATARNFVEAGANVCLYDMNEESLELAAKEFGSKASCFRGDVADEASVKEAIKETISSFGSIHINVNSAGIGGAARTVGRDGPMPLEKFEHIIRVNLIGTFNVLRLCAEAMQVNEPQNEDQERGVIVNVASIAAFDGQTGQAGYAASKGGIVSMTLPVARDLAKSGCLSMPAWNSSKDTHPLQSKSIWLKITLTTFNFNLRASFSFCSRADSARSTITVSTKFIKPMPIVTKAGK